MNQTLQIKLAGMAHGGSAIGRDEQNRAVFVPYTIPGETITAQVVDDKKRFVRAAPLQILEPSADRVTPECRHFTVCTGCHFQHIAYQRQVALKTQVVVEQLARIGGIQDAPVMPAFANPDPYHSSLDLTFSRTREGVLGLWSTGERRVIPIETCHLITPELGHLLADFDIDLPDLRKVTLRAGTDGGLLAALEIEDVEAPEINVDFPVSVALVLPNRIAINLIGDSYIVREIKGKLFRISAGIFFYANMAATEAMIDVVAKFARLDGSQEVLELHAGAGTLAAFLSEQSAQWIAIEANPDAVDDAVANLAETGKVSMYQGVSEEAMPAMTLDPEIVIVDPDRGLSKDELQQIVALGPEKIIYISNDIALLARDAKHLQNGGYHLGQIKPIDMQPQTFNILTVSLWQKK